MDFLHYGLFLSFLPIIAVPILLHLLTLHRLRTVELSTFRFLFDSYIQQRRRMRFMDALLAVLRTLFLLLLIMALARPVVRHWSALFGAGSGRDVVLLMDASASMNATTSGVSSLERAKRAAEAVVDRLAAEDRVTLVRVGGKPQELFRHYSADNTTIRDAIRSIDASPSRANLFMALSSVFGPGSSRLDQPHLYFFTDAQAGSWRELQELAGRMKLPEKTRLTVVQVGASDSQETVNCAVSGDPPSQHQVVAGLPITLRARVANHSRSETQQVTVTFWMDEQEVARKSLSLKPGEVKSTSLVYTPYDPGLIRGRYEISGDQFSEDDAFYFTLNVEPLVRVLIVNGNPAGDPLENEALYLQSALSSARSPSDDLNASTSGTSDADDPAIASSRELVRSLEVNEIPEGQLNADTLRDVSVVILANCGGLHGERFAWLRDFVAAGGGLLVFPGDKVNPDNYNKQFFPVPNTRDQFLISAKLSPAEGDPGKKETFERFASVDLAHPVLSVFDQPQSNYFNAVRAYRRFPLKLDAGEADAWPLMAFSDGSPALVESRFGEGRVVLAAFPATAKWSNLPLRPEFVPLVLRLVSHVRQRPGVETPSVVAADGLAEISVSPRWAPASGKITDLDGRVTRIQFQRTTSRLVSAYDLTTQKGYYTVEVNGGRTETLQHAETAFAVNLAPEESRPERVDEQQVREMLPHVELAFVDASAEAQQLHGAIGDERELWRPLIALLFVVIAIEFLLSTLGGQTTDNGETPGFAERLREVGTGKWVGRLTGAGTVE